MKTAEAAIKLIRDFEGCRLTAYQDGVGVWTIGYGHTLGVKNGDTITPAEASDLLIGDLQIAEECIEKSVKVPLTDNEHGALVSFVFNLGCGNLKKSTLLRLLNQMRYGDAGEEFLRWDFSGGVLVPGLSRRRQAERAMFING